MARQGVVSKSSEKLPQFYDGGQPQFWKALVMVCDPFQQFCQKRFNCAVRADQETKYYMQT